MREVAIVDTSIFCNLLNLPQWNQHREQVLKELEIFLKQSTSLLLPMATIYETGNHIAHISDGNLRRRYAEAFVQEVDKAISGETPWRVMQIPDREEIRIWLQDFPALATREIGIADLSIIKEWEKLQKLVPHHRVFIWSLDKHLKGYDYRP